MFGDIIMVDPVTTDRVKRVWNAGAYDRQKIRKGWMPPHIATFIRRSVFDRFGAYNTGLKIAADYKLLFRFLYKHQVPAGHIPEFLVKFRLGGASNRSLSQIWRANKEVRRAWFLNGFKPPLFLIPRKLLSKLLQYI